MTTATERRLVARASASVQERIARAAELSGRSQSQFLIDAALKEADRVTKESLQLEVSLEGFKTIVAALDQPPRPMSRLRQAARNFRNNCNEIRHHEDQQESR